MQRTRLIGNIQWRLQAAVLGPVLAYGSMFGTAAALAQQDARTPNVVLFFIDDMAYADPACYNPDPASMGYETPNLDRMAREGARLTDFYAAQPVCSASRAALLTGCYPNRIGVNGALGPNSTVGIADRCAPSWSGRAGRCWSSPGSRSRGCCRCST